MRALLAYYGDILIMLAAYLVAILLLRADFIYATVIVLVGLALIWLCDRLWR
jgi:hypothetical protein